MLEIINPLSEDCLLCFGGNNTQQTFCNLCMKSLCQYVVPRNVPPLILNEDLPVYALFEYEGRVKIWIQRLKNQPWGRVLADERNLLKRLLEHRLEAHPSFRKVSAVVSVPSRPMRRFFETDLSQINAQVLSEILNVPYLPLIEMPWLDLDSWRLPQKALNKWDRQDRSRMRRFKLRLAGNEVAGSSVLLVDDLCTTGASLKFVNSLLQNAGIKTSAAFVLAMAR